MTNCKLRVSIVQIVIVLSFLAFWEFGARNGLVNSFIFSSPSKIISTILALFESGELLVHIGVTLSEILLSFALGIGIAFILSILMYMMPFLARVIDPFLTMLNSLPKVALGPIIIIWVGANGKSIVTMALLINVFVSTITIYTGFKQTDALKIKLFDSFKATKWQKLTKLVIPENFRTIISALKINISMTLIGS